MEYSLDIEEFRKIPLEKYEKDFIFVVNGREFHTNRIIADILSPIIMRAHYQDSSFQKFIIKAEDIEELKESPLETYFDDFLKVGMFSKMTLDSSHQQYFSYYFYALGNIKEYLRLQPTFFEEITINNVIEKIKFISKLLQKFPMEAPNEDIFRNLIDFASQNFEHINKSEMSKLNIEMILKNKNLQLSNEDSLMEFIINLYEKNHEYSILFENVIFTNLTNGMIEKFISIFDIEFLGTNTWISICKRLLLTPTKNIESATRYNEKENSSIEFKFDENNKFNGIIKYLSKKTNGNILENGTVGITTNSQDEDCPLKNLVDLDSNHYYRSVENPLAIITFDFKDRFVQLTNYSIKTGTWNTNGGHLKDWIIEGSMDGNKYDEIDSRKNDSSLNGKQNSSSFEVQHKEAKFYHFIRLRQTGPTWWNNSKSYINRFEITNIEFFGFLKEPSNK